MIPTIQQAISPLREQLLSHSLYKKIQNPKDLQLFLEHHVYAVWDFMSLLKALQIELTCTKTPWVPTGNPQTRYLINEIVLAEETDDALDGSKQSHYEMYLDAMKACDADTNAIHLFLEKATTQPIFDAISTSGLAESIQQFLRFSFETIAEGKPHNIAAAFTFGREDLIPDMFSAILKEMQQNFPDFDLSKLIYYFDRHIELDGDEHGPMALQMIEELCGTDTQKWQEAQETSIKALHARIELWNGIEAAIAQQEVML